MRINEKNNELRLVNVAGALVVEGDSFVIVQEKNKHFYGKWNLPAGKCYKNELPTDTAVRETKEETNLMVKLQGLLGIYNEMKSHNTRVIKHIYIAKAISGELRVIDKNILAAKWITFDAFLKMDNHQMRSQDLKGIIKDYLLQKEPTN